MRKLNLHQGIGLLELMLSILVITAIILGATKYYLVTREEMKIAQAQDIINNVAHAGYKWVEGKPNFYGVSKLELVNMGLLPQSYTSKTDPWGGEIIVSAGTMDKMSWMQVMFNLANPAASVVGMSDKACGILVAKYGDCGDYSSVDSCGVSYGGKCSFSFRSP